MAFIFKYNIFVISIIQLIGMDQTNKSSGKALKSAQQADRSSNYSSRPKEASVPVPACMISLVEGEGRKAGQQDGPLPRHARADEKRESTEAELVPSPSLQGEHVSSGEALHQQTVSAQGSNMAPSINISISINNERPSLVEPKAEAGSLSPARQGTPASLQHDEAGLLRQASAQLREVERPNSQDEGVSRSIDPTGRKQAHSEGSAKQSVAEESKQAEDAEVKSGTQSNEIDDLDEQNFQEVKVHQIHQPYRRIQPGAGGPAAAEAACQAEGQNELDARVFQDEDFVLGEDDLANESANVSELNHTESNNGAIHQAVSSSISQPKTKMSQSQVSNNLPANSINRISSSGFHLRNSLNEHESSSSQLLQPASIQQPNTHSSQKLMSIQPARPSNRTQPAKSVKSPAGTSSQKNDLMSLIQNNQVSNLHSSSAVFNESTQRNKLKLFPQKQQHISRFQGARYASSSLSRYNQNGSSEQVFPASSSTYGASQKQAGAKNENGMFINNIVKQLEQTRRQLEMKDRQMQQLNLYVQEVIKENTELNMRLQYEERNNQMLLRQLNQLRKNLISQRPTEGDTTNYINPKISQPLDPMFTPNDGLMLFEQQQQIQGSSYVRQPRKPSGKIDQKLNQKEIAFENQSDTGQGGQTDPVEERQEAEDSPLPAEVPRAKLSPRFYEKASSQAQVASPTEPSVKEESEGAVIKPTDRSRRRYVATQENGSQNFIRDQRPRSPQDLPRPHDRAGNSGLLHMDENILPSLPSARNTQRKMDLLNEGDEGIGTVNLQRQRLLDLNFSELLSSPFNNANTGQDEAIQPSAPSANVSFQNFERLKNAQQDQPEQKGHAGEQDMSDLGGDVQASFLSQPSQVQTQQQQQYQAQQVNSFMPPTRASQGLKPKNLGSGQYKQLPAEDDSYSPLRNAANNSEFSFDEKQDDVKVVIEDGASNIHYDEENKSQDEESRSNGLNQISVRRSFELKREDRNEAQMNQIKINKVNEMDIKVSRFEKGSQNKEQISARVEEMIPNEEPLIQIRQFNGGGAASTLQELPLSHKQQFLSQVQENQLNLNIQSQLKQNKHVQHRNNVNDLPSGNLSGNQSFFNSFTNNIDERMSDLDHSGIQINHVNYPRVNLNKAQAERLQQKSIKDSESQIKSELAQVLNRNVFNNQRRMVSMHVQQLKPQFQHKNIRQPIIEEEKEQVSDFEQTSQDADLMEMEQSSKIKPKSSHDQHYLQQQLYLSQQRRKQMPITNVNGDKGNTIIDVDEQDESELNQQQQRMASSRSIGTRKSGEQAPDYFDNIDNIDVNIEETFSANQQALYIQNFSNLGNLSQLRFQRGVGSQNRSDRRNMLANPQRSARQMESLNNQIYTGIESLNNQSFSQVSQLGENLAESRDYDNEINQIRISNRNFPNHQQMLRQNELIRQRMGQNRQNQMPAPNFGGAQDQDENPNSSRMDEIGRERRSILSEIAIPQISQIQRLHPRQVRHEGSQMAQRQSMQLSQLQQPRNAGQHSVHETHESQLPLPENEDLIDEQDPELLHSGSRQQTQRHQLGMNNQLMHFGQHQQYRLQNRNQDQQRQAIMISQQNSENLLSLSQQNSGAGRRDPQQIQAARQVTGPPSQARISSINHAGISGGQMVGIAGPAIRGEGMLQFDDMGLDEYDVADERQHEIGFDRWELNLDSMTYEQLLELQARIGYVNKGLNLDKIRSFPQMTKAELKRHLKGQQNTVKVGQESQSEEDKFDERHDGTHSRQSQRLSVHVAQVNSGQNSGPASRSIMQPHQKVHAEHRSGQHQSEFIRYEPTQRSFQLENLQDYMGGNDLMVQPPKIQQKNSNQITQRNAQLAQLRNEEFSGLSPAPLIDIHSGLSISDQMADQRQRMLLGYNISQFQQFQEQLQTGEGQKQDRGRYSTTNPQLHGELRSIRHGAVSRNPVGDEPFEQGVSFRSERKPLCQHLSHQELPDGGHLTQRASQRVSQSASQRSQLRSSRYSSQVKIDDCAICFDNISDSQIVKVLEPCNHYFHNDCINQWLIIEKRCPMCMQCLTSGQSQDDNPEQPEPSSRLQVRQGLPRQSSQSLPLAGLVE